MSSSYDKQPSQATDTQSGGGTAAKTTPDQNQSRPGPWFETLTFQEQEAALSPNQTIPDDLPSLHWMQGLYNSDGQAPEISTDQAFPDPRLHEPGAVVVTGAAAATEYSFDDSYTPTLIKALKDNPDIDIDEILTILGQQQLDVPGAEQKYHNPQVAKFGQTAENTSVCRNGAHHSLLIANQNYYPPNSVLETPISESAQFAAQLQSRGYQTDQQNDLSKAEMDNAINQKVATAKANDDVIFYYAGHGSPEGLVGVNNQLYTYGEINDVVKKLSNNGAFVRFIMDSCHSGTGADLVRSERQGELNKQIDTSNIPNHIVAGATNSLVNSKNLLIDHVNRREEALYKLETLLSQFAEGTLPFMLLSAAIRLTIESFDRAADKLWRDMRAYMLLLNVALQKISAKSHLPDLPVKITQYRTLGNIMDAIENFQNSLAEIQEDIYQRN